MTASIEWLCRHAGVLRLHEGQGGGVGDPYVWCCTLSAEGGDANLKGVLSTPTVPGLRAIDQALRHCGFRKRVYERRTAKGVRTLTKDLYGT